MKLNYVNQQEFFDIPAKTFDPVTGVNELMKPDTGRRTKFLFKGSGIRWLIPGEVYSSGDQKKSLKFMIVPV
jgi:hypothetical protein